MKATMIKRTLALLAVLVMVLGLAACTGNNGGETTTTTTGGNTEVTGGEDTTTTVGGTDATTTVGGTDATTKPNVITTVVNKVTTTTTKPVSGGKTSLTKEQVMAKMPANLKGTTVTYFYWNPQSEQMEGEAVKKWEAATGCKLKYEKGVYESFQEELAVRISSDNSPDIVRLLGPVTWQVTALQPVTTSGFDFNDTAWDQDVMALYTYNNNCYALNLNNTVIADVAVIYYNTKALQDADMDNDDQNPYKIWKKNPNNWTWEKFWELCDDFVDANEGKSGYYGATFEYESAYIRAMGGTAYYYDPAAGRLVNDMKNPVLANSLKVTAEMMEKGLLIGNTPDTAFNSGKILFYWTGPYSARTLDARQTMLKKLNRLGVVPTPTDSKYQVMYEYTAFGIPKGAKNPGLVPYYLRYILDRSAYDWSKVYCNAQAQEVLDFAMAKTNRWYGYAAGCEQYYNEAINAGSSQVKTVLDSYYDAVQTKVDNENERIAIWGEM